MRVYRRVRNGTAISALFLRSLDLPTGIDHAIGGRLTESQDAIPGILSDALRGRHVREDFRDHGIGLPLALGKGGEVHILCLLRIFSLYITDPIVDDGRPGRLEEGRARHSPAIILADQELHKLPGSLRILRACINAEIRLW